MWGLDVCGEPGLCAPECKKENGASFYAYQTRLERWEINFQRPKADKFHRKITISSITIMIREEKWRKSMKDIHASGNGYQKDIAETSSVPLPSPEKSPCKMSKQSSKIPSLSKFMIAKGYKTEKSIKLNIIS